MKGLYLLTVVAMIAAPAFAGPDVLPISGVGYLNYNAATGEITPVTANDRRVGFALWSAGYEYVGYTFTRNPDQGHGASDWGDIVGPAVVGGIEFSSFTNSMASDGDVCVTILYYTEDNGYASAGKVFTAGIVMDNIPGNTHNPNQYWGYQWRVELGTPFVLDGSDLDGDTLTDFGYFMFCSGETPGCVHGSGVWDRALVDPNDLPPEAPGVEDLVDVYADPNWNLSCGNIDPNNINAVYVATGSFTNAFGQMHHVLFAPVCPNRGESGRYCQADIDGSADCIVGLGDLAQLLGSYGCESDPNGPDLCSLTMGDVDPYDEWFPGDGDVDLGDLAELLGQYGDDCNWP